MRVIPYFVFKQNCKEAMEFYHSCFGGNLSMSYVKDTPMAGNMPLEMQDLVMNAQLICEDVIFMASDSMDHTVTEGSNISLMISAPEEKVKEYYEKLQQEGIIEQALEIQFWGDLYGAIVDKFGIHWSFQGTK